jgi:hypothetical protein
MSRRLKPVCGARHWKAQETRAWTLFADTDEKPDWAAGTRSGRARTGSSSGARERAIKLVCCPPAVTSGQLRVQGRDSGHQPLLLPRGEPSSPAGDVDASHRHQLRADAGQRHQRDPDRHPRRSPTALCMGKLDERQLTRPQPGPDRLPLPGQPDGPEAGRLALLVGKRWRNSPVIQAQA